MKRKLHEIAEDYTNLTKNLHQQVQDRDDVDKAITTAFIKEFGPEGHDKIW